MKKTNEPVIKTENADHSGAAVTGGGHLRERGIERRRKMLDAALRLLCEKGFDGISIADVVKEAGGSLSSAYKFFRNKEGLLFAVFEETMRKMSGMVSTIELSGDSFSERLSAFIRAVFDARTDVQAKLFIFGGFAVESFRRCSLAAFESLLLPRVTEALEKIADETDVSFRIPAEDAALILVRLLRGTLIEVILTSGADKARLEKAVRLTTAAVSSFTEPRVSKRCKRRVSSSPSK